MRYIIKDFKVNTLPAKGEPDSRYYVPNGNGTDIDEYITDKNGLFRKVNPQKEYIHIQGVVSDTWNVNHELGYYPSVAVVDSSGSLVHGDIRYIDEDNIVITFSAGFSGKAYLS